MSYRTVPSTLASEQASVARQLRRERRGHAGLGIPLLAAPFVGLVSLLEQYFPTDEEDARRELEKYQDPGSTPGDAVDPTIWRPLALLLGTTAVVYFVSTSSSTPSRKRKRR